MISRMIGKRAACPTRAGLLRPIAFLVGAIALASVQIVTASGAAAQSVNNWVGWMNNLNNQGLMASRRMYYACLSHPGACQPAPGALDQANRQLQGAYGNYIQGMNRNYNRIYNSNKAYDYGVIRQQPYCWRIPYYGTWRFYCR